MAKPRVDDYLLMRDTYQGSRTGESVLIVGGGPSGKRWREVYDEVKPDALMGVNGVVQAIGELLDYWLVIEVEAYLAPWINDRRPKHIFINNTAVIQPNAKVEPGFVKIGRVAQHEGSRLTDYGHGLMLGDYTDRVLDYTGTVMWNAFHLACLLGFWKVHTVGLDLCIPTPEGPFHWYDEGIPEHALKRYKLYKGVYSLPVLIDTARFFLETVKDWAAYEGIGWTDHSDGLLQRMSPQDWEGAGPLHGNNHITPEVRLRMYRERLGKTA